MNLQLYIIYNCIPFEVILTRVSHDIRPHVDVRTVLYADTSQIRDLTILVNLTSIVGGLGTPIQNLTLIDCIYTIQDVLNTLLRCIRQMSRSIQD